MPPFRIDLAAWVLRSRPENLVDRRDGQCYRRALPLEGRAVEVAVAQTSPDYDGARQALAPWRNYAGLIYFHLLLDRLAGTEVTTPGGYPSYQAEPPKA